jgi:hypothetical protein
MKVRLISESLYQRRLLAMQDIRSASLQIVADYLEQLATGYARSGRKYTHTIIALRLAAHHLEKCSKGASNA